MAKHCRRMLWAAALVFALEAQCFAAQPAELIPVGKTIGIELQTEHVTVVGFSNTVQAAEQAGLQKGDVIEKINDVEIHSTSDISAQLGQADAPVKVTVRRNQKRQEFLVKPETTSDGPLLGILARDTLAGIGTVTYYDPQTGNFGALGHGVNDNQTARLVEMDQGRVVNSSVIKVEKSKQGKPGALRGALENVQIGTVDANTSAGIFGTLDTFVAEQSCIPVAELSELRTGDATILSNVSGTQTQSYTIEIEQIEPNDAHGRNMLLRVTDQNLIDQTGGICQGMSGSPILQDGKLVGAVTHVLVSDPTMGYGIYIGNMLAADAAA